MRLELLNKLKEHKGLISEKSLYMELISNGLLSTTFINWKQWSDYFHIRLIVNAKSKGSKTISYFETSEEFKVSEISIKRAVNFFK